MPIKPEELPALLDFLSANTPEIDSVDKFKTHFDSRFTSKDNVDDITKGKIVGKMVGSFESKLKRGLQEAGIEFTESDFKDKKFEDALDLGLQKVKAEKDKFEAYKKTQPDPTKEFTELDKKYKVLETQYNEVNGKFTTLTSDFDTFKSTKDKELKDYKRDSKVKDIYSNKVQFADGVTDLTKKGYFATLNEMYEPDYDEIADKVYAIDKKSGQRLAGKAAGTFKEYEEVLPEVGIKAGVWKINNHAKNQDKNIQQQRMEAPVIGAPNRQVAPRIS